jgi:hypothetical protein
VDGLATKSSTIANILESVLSLTGHKAANNTSNTGTDLTAG